MVRAQPSAKLPNLRFPDVSSWSRSKELHFPRRGPTNQAFTIRLDFGNHLRRCETLADMSTTLSFGQYKYENMMIYTYTCIISIFFSLYFNSVSNLVASFKFSFKCKDIKVSSLSRHPTAPIFRGPRGFVPHREELYCTANSSCLVSCKACTSPKLSEDLRRGLQHHNYIILITIFYYIIILIIIYNKIIYIIYN